MTQQLLQFLFGRWVVHAVKACRSDDRDAYADAYAYAPLSFALLRFSCSDIIIIVVVFQVQTQTI